ncbi:hypothetical protein [Streptomyces sp. CS62]|uniref:hypothetical protein n=1 Tax=Streptomyces sp. CS62 TaxID=3119268 RepID=UPI002F95F5CA
MHRQEQQHRVHVEDEHDPVHGRPGNQQGEHDGLDDRDEHQPVHHRGLRPGVGGRQVAGGGSVRRAAQHPPHQGGPGPQFVQQQPAHGDGRGGPRRGPQGLAPYGAPGALGDVQRPQHPALKQQGGGDERLARGEHRRRRAEPCGDGEDEEQLAG